MLSSLVFIPGFTLAVFFVKILYTLSIQINSSEIRSAYLGKITTQGKTENRVKSY